MLRAILGVIVGYVVMAVIVMLCFTGLQFGLGTEKVFKPGSYEPSSVFIAIALVISALAAMAGGYLCATIARTATPHKVLAVIVLVLGLLGAAVSMGTPDPGPRAGDITPMEAAMKARQPMWYSMAIAVIGCAGTIVGGNMKKRPASPQR